MFFSMNEKVAVPLIIVVAVIVVAILLSAFLTKKKKSENKPDDRSLIEQNSKAVNIIIAIADNDDVKERLCALREKIKYLIPTNNYAVYEADSFMSQLLHEFRIKLSASPHDLEIADNYIKQISIAIESRNTLL